MEVDLHVTNKCNLKCNHCVYYSGEEIMPDITLETVKNEILKLANSKKSICYRSIQRVVSFAF